MADVLTLSNVTKRFDRFTAVDGFSLCAPQGDVLGFLGPNGAGKTTTIRMVMSIFYPDQGERTAPARICRFSRSANNTPSANTRHTSAPAYTSV